MFLSVVRIVRAVVAGIGCALSSLFWLRPIYIVGLGQNILSVESFQLLEISLLLEILVSLLQEISVIKSTLTLASLEPLTVQYFVLLVIYIVILPIVL